ncbi:MAG: hypothetical protein ACI9JT_001946 [Polaribacter sp.]|jgi:hypothetical protein
MKDKLTLGSKEYLRHYQEALLQHIFLFEKLNKELPKVEDGQSIAFSMMVWPIIESCQSILILSEGKKLRDSMGLARMVLDLALNIGYFSVKGQSAIDKALKHAHQKSFRDLNRDFNIDDIRIFIGLNNIESVEMPEKLKEAIEEYTTENGKEERAWTGDNVFKKIKLIRQRHGKGIGISYAMATFEIYRHSSEVLHGTMFGSMYALGITELRQNWPKDNVDREKHVYTELSLLLNVLSLLTSATMSIILSHYPNEELEAEVKKLSLNLQIKK